MEARKMSVIHIFGKYDEELYEMTHEKELELKKAIMQTIKDRLPEEAFRVDVLHYVFSEMREWITRQPLKL